VRCVLLDDVVGLILALPPLPHHTVRFFPEATVLNVDMMAQLSAWLHGNRTWRLIFRYVCACAHPSHDRPSGCNLFVCMT
jgi:hypothetical protein